MEQEIWFDIPNWEGQYKISNFGNVLKFKNDEWTFQKLSIDNRGYYKFCRKIGEKQYNFFPHSILCKLLYGEKNRTWVPDHINEDKLDNHHSNLQWLTNGDNIRKAAKKRKENGTQKKPIIKKVIQKTLDEEIVAIHNNCAQAALFLGKKYSGGVHRACKKLLPTYLGYIWEHVD